MKKRRLQNGVTIALVVFCCFLEFYLSSKYSTVNHQVLEELSFLEPTPELIQASSFMPAWSSRVHCIGENFQNVPAKSARFRSCQYSNLCWNKHDVIYYDGAFNNASEYFSSTRPAPVQVLPHDDDPWMPKIQGPFTDGAPFPVVLPEDTVWIPIRSTRSFCQRTHANKQVLLDFHLPIFTLLEMFRFNQHKVLVTILDNACPLDVLMINTTANFTIQFHKSTRFCAHTALAGMGWLGARHYDTTVVAGQERLLHRPHNLRRSFTFWKFRTFMIRHVLGIKKKLRRTSTVPVTLLLPSGSHESGTQTQLQQGLTHCKITRVIGLPLSFVEQVDLALSSMIYIVFGQDIPETVILMPQGSVLIVIGSTTDWDMWNNVGHIRVHWLTSSQSLLVLMQEEVERVLSEEWRDDTTTYTAPVDRDVVLGPKFPGSLHARLHSVQGSPLPGRVHCIGENFNANETVKSWFRSCRYENICLDLRTREFSLYNVASEAISNDTLHLSSWPTEVVMASQPQKLLSSTTRWKPFVRAENIPGRYHQLHEDVVWISYKEWDVCNVGHVFWDTWLPIYTILEMFNLQNHVILLTKRRRVGCKEGGGLFPFLMARQDHVPVERDLGVRTILSRRTRTVCSRSFLAGMAWLQDHGHGYLESDFEQPENIGRGPQLSRFRDHVLRNANLTRIDLKGESRPWKIVFSAESSKHPQRRRGFAEEVSAVVQRFGSRVRAHSIKLWNYSVVEQMELATRTAIFVSVVGGGTFPAFFLPKGASLILLYPPGEKLDWDVWNNFGDIFTHWINLDDLGVDVILPLIQAELDRIEAAFL